MEYASDIMTKGVEMIHEETTLKLAAQKMKDNNIGFLVVGDGAQATGCVTDRDLVIQAMARGLDANQHVVSEVMTPHILSCKVNTKVKDIIDQMRENKIYRILVTDTKDNPVGVVSFGDIAARAEESVPIDSLSEISHH